jgi:hypothetical protein
LPIGEKKTRLKNSQDGERCTVQECIAFQNDNIPKTGASLEGEVVNEKGNDPATEISRRRYLMLLEIEIN